jgi:hypothetical protein
LKGLGPLDNKETPDLRCLAQIKPNQGSGMREHEILSQVAPFYVAEQKRQSKAVTLVASANPARMRQSTTIQGIVSSAVTQQQAED